MQINFYMLTRSIKLALYSQVYNSCILMTWKTILLLLLLLLLLVCLFYHLFYY